MIALHDVGRPKAGEPDHLPPWTSDLAGELPATPSVMACPVEPTGPHRPQPEDRVGGGQMEGDPGGFADL